MKENSLASDMSSVNVPEVSVIMPVYNASAYVEASIASVLRQSYTNFELLIIDDGSTDDSASKIRQFKDSRIRFFAQTNRGVGAARNVGLREMAGGYFCFIDADDVMPGNSLRDRYEKFRNNPTVEFVDGKVEVFDRSFSERLRIYMPEYRGNPLRQLFMLSEKCFFGQTWMVRRVKGVAYQFNEMLSHGEDLFFYMEQARRGGSYDYVTTPVLLYRKHEKSAMQNTDKLFEGYEKLYAILKSWPEFSFKFKFIFYSKTRKFMILEYLAQKKYRKAFWVLFSRSVKS